MAIAKEQNLIKNLEYYSIPVNKNENGMYIITVKGVGQYSSNREYTFQTLEQLQAFLKGYELCYDRYNG